MKTDSKRFEDLAERIMFGSVTVLHGAAPDGFKYRRHMTIENLIAAIQRGRKNGRGKLESEVSFIALALKKVLVVDRKEVDE